MRFFSDPVCDNRSGQRPDWTDRTLTRRMEQDADRQDASGTKDRTQIETWDRTRTGRDGHGRDADKTDDTYLSHPSLKPSKFGKQNLPDTGTHSCGKLVSATAWTVRCRYPWRGLPGPVGRAPFNHHLPKKKTGAQVFATVFRPFRRSLAPTAPRLPRTARSLDVARLRVLVQMSATDFSMLHLARTKLYW